MKKFIVERNLPGAANLSPEELQTILQNSNNAVTKLGKCYTWIESFITNDKIYCVHIAESAEAIRAHAKLAKLPVHTISEVKIIMDPVMQEK